MTVTVPPRDLPAMLRLEAVEKVFVMHLRGGARLPVIRNASFELLAGECVALDGPSGTGKSSILKMVFGNYRVDAGAILVRDGERLIDMRTADPRAIIGLRRTTIGYVSQFLRAIPRVGCFDLVMAAARDGGLDTEAAHLRAAGLLTRLNVPERLWPLPPATFSGGEQQRVNIACGFAARRPILLIDEPTASLDAANREVVISIINESKAAGTAILGIFHDPDVRARVADRIIDVRTFTPEMADRA